jgi:hypothetical protein
MLATHTPASLAPSMPRFSTPAAELLNQPDSSV